MESGAIEWLIWRVLHCLLSLYSALSAMISASRRFISSVNAENRQTKVRAVADRPLTVAAVFEKPEEALDEARKVPELLCWLSAANASHVTLYDAQGILKRSEGQIWKTFKLQKTDDAQKIQCYSEAGYCNFPTCSNFVESLPEVNGSTYLTATNGFVSTDRKDVLCQSHLSSSRSRKKESLEEAVIFDDKPQFDAAGVGHMKVELLSLQDGQGSLLRATRNVCENAYKIHYAEKSRKVRKVTEEDVNKSLLETGGEGPDPDLLLLFGTTRSLLGFPPWRIRLTEIVHLGSLKNLTEQSIASAMIEFARKTHRYGR